MSLVVSKKGNDNILNYIIAKLGLSMVGFIILDRSWRTGAVPETEGKTVSLKSSKRQEGNPRELQTSQPHIHSRKGNETAHDGCHL